MDWVNIDRQKFPGWKIFILFVFFVITIACEKEEYTLPAQVEFEFLLKQPEAATKSINEVHFSTGYMVVENIQFDGVRSEGEDVYFMSEFEQPVVCNLSDGSSSEKIDFDIPQGLYKHIKLRIYIKVLDTLSAFSMEGMYNRDTGDPVPVQFEFPMDERLQIIANSGNGNSEIVLNKDEISKATVEVDANYLFQLVNENLWSRADISIIDDKEVILVNPDNNHHIFNIVGNRLEKSISTVFN